MTPHWRACYAQEGEDIILARLFEGATQGFYVDVGAHHPRRYSNTYALYRLGWSGVCIDANPGVSQLFSRARPRDVFVQSGVSDQRGQLTYYRFNEPALNTFDPVLAAQREACTPYFLIESIVVQVQTLADILAVYPAPHGSPSLLSVDVEGYDLKVLRSNDWGAFRPRFVLTESIGTSIKNLLNDPQCRFLSSVGYAPLAKTMNTVFYRDMEDR